MKNLALIKLLLLITISSFGQIKFNGSIEGGYYTHRKTLSNVFEAKNQEYDFYSNTFSTISEPTINQSLIQQHYANHMYIELQFNAEYKGFNFSQNIFNIGTYEGEGYTITPLDIMYTTRLSYKWKSFELGAEHMCTHPIVSNMNDNLGITYRESYDKVFVKFNFGRK